MRWLNGSTRVAMVVVLSALNSAAACAVGSDNDDVGFTNGFPSFDEGAVTGADGEESSGASGDTNASAASTNGEGDGDADTTSASSSTDTGDGDGDGDPTSTTSGDGDGDGDPTSTTSGDGDGDGDPTTTGDGDGDCVIYQENFDTSDGAWFATGENSDWARGVPTGGPGGDHTGGGSLWATDLSGDPNLCQDSRLQSATIDLSAYAGQSVSLSFWHWYSFRNMNYSGAIVEVEQGGTFAKVTPTTGYDSGAVNCSGGSGSCSPCALDELSGAYTNDGSEEVWQQAIVDLSPWAGQTVRVGFHFGSHDGYICCSNTPGWYIDDVLVTTPGC